MTKNKERTKNCTAVDSQTGSHSVFDESEYLLSRSLSDKQGSSLVYPSYISKGSTAYRVYEFAI